MATYEELKRRVANGGKTITAKSRFEELKERVNNERFERDVQKVDPSYINMFLDYAGSFMDTAKDDYDNVGWGNALSTYRTRRDAWDDLDYRRSVIQRWAEDNKANLDADDYTSLSGFLTDFQKQGSGVVDSFSSAKDYYGQFDTEDAYNQYKAYYDKWGHYADAEDYKDFSAKGAAIKNPTMSEVERGFNLFGNKNVGNIVTYSRDNYDRIGMSEASGSPSVGKSLYHFMRDDEVGIYNYLLAKEGDKAAQSFLDDIEEELNYRMGKSQSDVILGMESPTLRAAALGAVSLGSGVDQWGSGVRQLLSSDKLPTTAAQFGNANITEHLNGFGKELYTAGNTIGNMAPSILLSNVAAGLGVGAKIAQGIGSVTLGASASGNAYGQALSDGYNKRQARLYSALVGASEAGLQSAIGGIASLGGLSGKMAGKIAAIDNSLLRIAAKMGTSIGGEIVEEELQNFLEPAFRSILFGEDYDAPKWDELLETAVVTALSTGLMEGPGNIGGDIANSRYYKKNYGEVQQELVAKGLEFADGTLSKELAQKYQKVLDANGSLNGYQLGRMVEANEQQFVADDMTTIQNAAKERLTALGETGDLTTISAALAKQAAGEKLTRAEEQVIANSKYGQRVANEMNADNIAEGGFASDWAQNIGTNRINAETYNAPLMKLANETAGVKPADAPAAKAGQETVAPVDDSTPAPTAPVTARYMASDEVAVVAAAVKEMGVSPMVEQSLVDNFDGTDGSIYAADVKLAYQYGKMNFPKSSLEKLDIKPYQAQHAYNLGRSDAKAEAAASVAEDKASEIGLRKLAANDEVYQAATEKFGEDRAFAVASAYRAESSNLGVSEFMDGFHVAYEAGVNGTPLKDTMAAESKLTPVQIKTAWSLGNDERTGKVVVRSVKRQGTGTFVDKSTGKATDSWEAFTTVLSGVAKKIGVDIETVDAIKAGSKTANGAMVRDMMTMVLSRNADNNVQSLGHELGEFAEAFNPDDMDSLRVDILRYWAKTQSATSVDKMVKAYQGTYKQAEGGKTYEQAESEAINDALGAILASEEGVDALMEWLQSDSGMNAQEQKTFLQKLADLFQSIVNGLKKLLKNGNLTPVQQDMVHMEIEQKQDILKRLFAAVDQAAVNAKETGEYYAETVNADSKSDLDGETDTVHSISPDFAPGVTEWYESTTEEERAKSGGYFKIGTTSTPLLSIGIKDRRIYFGKSKIAKIVDKPTWEGGHKGDIDINDIAKIPELLEDPVAIVKSKSIETSIVVIGEIKAASGKTLTAVVELNPRVAGGMDANINIVVSAYDRSNENLRNLLTDAEVLYLSKDKKRTDTWLMSLRVQFPSDQPMYGSIGKVTYDGEKVKSVTGEKIKFQPIKGDEVHSLPVDTDYLAAVERGDTDTAQKMVDEAANLAMPDSKIRDKQGNLIPVYHGTKEMFYEFDTSIKGGQNGTAEGFGIYTSDNPEVTEAYGNRQIKMYANITKPATSDKKTISPAKLAALIKDTCVRQARKYVEDGEYDSVKDALMDTWVSNYVYTYDIGMDRAYRDTANSILRMNDSDMSVVQEVMAGMAIRDYAEATDFYHNSLIPITGFDGFSTHWENSATGKKSNIYLAFDSSQMKSADPVTYDDNGKVIPLSERFNPQNEDIRFSLPVDGESMTEMTNREILEAVAEQAENADLTPVEMDALRIFKSRLDKVRNLQEKRAEHGTLWHDQQFGGKSDEAVKTMNRMKMLDKQLDAAEKELVKAEATGTLQGIVERAHKAGAKKQRAYDDNTLRRYKERRDNAESVKKYRKRVQDKTEKLSEMLLRNSDKQHVPEQLKVAVGEFLTSIDFTSKRQLSGGEATKKDLRYTDTLNKLRRVLQNQVNYMENPGNNEGLGVYLDMPDGFVQAIDEHIEAVKKTIRNTDVATGAVNNMTAEELKDLDFFLTVLTSSINKVNALIANGRYQYVSEAAMDTIAYLNEMKEFGGKHTKVDKFLNWDNTTPQYAFKRFGDSGSAIFEGLQDGWDKLALNSKQVIDFAEKTYTEKEVKAWSEKIHSIELDGRTAQMTTAQIMSLYCLVKREQAQGHLFGGGMRIGNIEIKAKVENGKVKGKQDLQQAEAFHLTMEDVARITSLLTDRQIAVADALQKYMNTVGSKWGNEVSFSRFGYNSFTEENYFPIESDKNNLQAVDLKARANDLFRLLNMCFTKGLTPKANNALVVNNIFDVFAAHMSDMAKYNALALPVLDAMKFYNFKDSTKLEDGKLSTATVQKAIERAYGGAAKGYFIKFMKDLNGVQDGGRNESENFAMKMVGNYKVAAVGANLRVALLQPTSYVRAVAVIDPKYLAKAVTMKPATKEMLEHSGIAVWKSLGFYDTNIGRAVRDQIKGEATVRDKVVEKSMAAAELGDKLTWGVLWNACKLECTAKGDKSTEAVAKRFREVVYATQVVDSTMTRSQTMRSSSSLTKMLTSFMSEPTLAYNMLVDSYNTFNTLKRKGDKNAWQKCRQPIARSMMAYVASMTAAALAESLFDALRDDDDYETFLEKFWEAFWGDKSGYDGKYVAGNLIADLNILNKLPILKDIVSEVTGYENTRMDTQWFSSIIDAVNAWKSDTRPLYGKIYKTMQAISRFAGLPASNLMREVVTIYNNTIGAITGNKLRTYEPSVKTSIKEALAGGHLTEEEAAKELVNKGEAKDANDAYFIVKKWMTGDSSNYQGVYDAMLEGESITAAVKDLTDHGYEKDDVLSAIKTQIGKWYKGTDDKPASITKQQALSMLTKYGGMTRDEASDKVDAWSFQKEHPTLDWSEGQITTYYSDAAPSGISVSVYDDYLNLKSNCKGTDINGDGKADRDSVKREVLEVIHKLPITGAQKDALYYLNGWSKSTINEAPWH